MESNSAVRLHFEDLSLKKYFKKTMGAFVGEKSQSVWLSTFDQCEVFLFQII